MPKINKEWVAEQLTHNKTIKASGDAVLKLLDTWNSLELTPKQAKDAVMAFSKLSLGEPIYVPTVKNEIWIEARPGDIVVGDEMLVKTNAYDNPDLAVIHNGRRGKVVAIRYGNIIIKYTDDKKPEINDAHHSPYTLLKLVK
jgi:hypothetical protein